MQMAHCMVETPFGLMLAIGSDGRAIVSSEFLSKRRAAAGRQAPDPLLREAVRQANAYFRKRLRRFDLPLALMGTPFQTAVWHFVSHLETGEIISYGDLARAIGHPLAHRAVAAAMRKTPLDLFVPAHRAVGGDGSVRGAGLRSLRRRLLEFEGIILR
jgi:methylated-DNA-[protein]-cysteine S-methyltransferase